MKKKLLTLLQFVVTLGILYWVFHDPKKRSDMLEAIKAANLGWLLAGIAAYGFVEVVALARWQILIRVQGIVIGWWRMFALLMIGVFFNLFMPGGTGGDVIKIYFLLKETPEKKAQAFLAALVDRIIGLLGLILLTCIILWQKYAWLQQTEMTRNLTWTLLAILLSACSGIAFAFVVSGFNLVSKLPHKMPFRDKLIDISVAYHQYARAWKASLAAIFLSFGLHIGSFYVFYYAARSLSLKIPLGDFFAVMPIINVISSLPISVGGTGVREGLFQTLLGLLCNIKESDAVVISLLGFMIIAVWGLIGGVIYLLYRPSDHAGIGQIQDEVGRIEHKIAEEQ